MKQIRRGIIWVVVVLVVAVALYRIGSKFMGGKSEKVELPIAVRVMQPVMGLAEDAVEISGTIVGKDEANAYSKVPGKLAKYEKQEGDWVDKNDTIAWVERDEIGLQYALSPVKAPVSGQVAQRFVDIGEMVAAGMGMPGTPVARVVNPRELEIHVNIIERDISRILIGQKVKLTVSAFPNDVFHGVVARIAPVIDPLSRTSLVKIRINQQDGKLKSGMLANVHIIVAEKADALLIPKDAILKQNRLWYVYVIEKNRVVRRDLQLGWVQDDRMQILAGLSKQDQVVVQGQSRLTEASLVQIVE